MLLFPQLNRSHSAQRCLSSWPHSAQHCLSSWPTCSASAAARSCVSRLLFCKEAHRRQQQQQQSSESRSAVPLSSCGCQQA